MNIESTKGKKVLLYSGGMDSWLIDKLWKPDVKVFVNIGTKNNKEEIKRLPEDVIVVNCDLAPYEDKNKNYLLPLRNLFFVSLASYYGDIICLGATGSSTHYDKNETFAQYSEQVINYLFSEAYDKQVKIVMPYKDKTKTEILEEYLEDGGNVEEAWNSSFSCYNPKNGKMCGECTSCKKRLEAFRAVGFEPNIK